MPSALYCFILDLYFSYSCLMSSGVSFFSFLKPSLSTLSNNVLIDFSNQSFHGLGSMYLNLIPPFIRVVMFLNFF